MAQVLLSIGSNINREDNIKACLGALHEEFSSVKASPVYESEAIGFSGDNFFNLVVLIETDLSVGELSTLLKKIEDDNGRIRGGERFSARTLDIDILTYDQLTGLIDTIELPRDEILSNAFVLLPMADLVPDQKHPRLNKTYAELWSTFDKRSQKLWRVDL